jgi:hypothetical protein
MKNDPINSKKYEKELWQLHIKVTELKDAYYIDKLTSKPGIKNAYVTFRSVEGRERAIQAYETTQCTRIFAE